MATFYPKIYVILVMFVLCIYAIKAAPGSRKMIVSPADNIVLIILSVLLICLMSTSPIEYGTDKYRYTELFYDVVNNVNVEDVRDRGWLLYTKVCSLLSFGNHIIYFLITSVLYVLGFAAFAAVNYSAKKSSESFSGSMYSPSL